MKRKEPKEITDEMIGQADKVCACSAIVGDIIKATNEVKKTSLKSIVKSVRRKKKTRSS
jgi:hypothetical protein